MGLEGARKEVEGGRKYESTKQAGVRPAWGIMNVTVSLIGRVGRFRGKQDKTKQKPNNKLRMLI